jgi:hypothetical protein
VGEHRNWKLTASLPIQGWRKDSTLTSLDESGLNFTELDRNLTVS